MAENNLNKQLIRIKAAGDVLEKAPMMKTKQAAQMLGNETLTLLGQLVDTVNQQSDEIKQLKEQLL